MAQPRILEGTGEQLAELLQQFPNSRFRLVPLTVVEEVPEPVIEKEVVTRPSIYGKYAFVGGGSEAFAKAKQEEIDLEDRVRR